MKKNKLDIIYKTFVRCKNKHSYTLDITRYYKEFIYLLNEAGILENIKEIICKLSIDLFITSLAYSMFNFKEILLEMFRVDYPFLEPETEILIIDYFKEIIEHIYEATPILKEANIILPYDIVYKDCKIFILKLAVCLDKNNEGDKNVI